MKTLQSLALIGCLALGIADVSQAQNPSTQDPAVQQSIVSLVDASNPFDVAVTDVAIKGFLRKYVKNAIVDQKSNYFAKLEIELAKTFDDKGKLIEYDKKKGREKIVDAFSDIHRLCLDLALENGVEKVPQEDVEIAAQNAIYLQYQLSRHSGYSADSEVNYNDPNLRKATADWVLWRTWEFQKLFSAKGLVEAKDIGTEKGRLDYVKDLYQTAFTTADYEKYLRLQDYLNWKMGEATVGSINGSSVRMQLNRNAAKKETGRLFQAGKETRAKTLELYFGDR